MTKRIIEYRTVYDDEDDVLFDYRINQLIQVRG